MKGIIYYYSATGNTKLACEYIASKITNCNLELADVLDKDCPPPVNYDFMGVAAYTDFIGMSRIMEKFLEDLPPLKDKHGIVFTTCGNVSGRILEDMAIRLEEKGMRVIGSHALHTPENYPLMIARGKAFEDSPNEEEMQAFEEFIKDLDSKLAVIEEGKTVDRIEVKADFPFNVIPRPPRVIARWFMGRKRVDKNLCNECGICEKACPYGAIKLDPKPLFEQGKCFGCFACYNRCPQKAILTWFFKGKHHYPRPNEQLVEKLKIEKKVKPKPPEVISRPVEKPRRRFTL